MYISELEIDGYKNCNKKSKISFNPGINILVGENASGKTTIIDAIRMILRDSEQGYITKMIFINHLKKMSKKKYLNKFENEEFKSRRKNYLFIMV